MRNKQALTRRNVLSVAESDRTELVDLKSPLVAKSPKNQMHCAAWLDLVVQERLTILQLLACEEETVRM